jgi:hypothetical protein
MGEDTGTLIAALAAFAVVLIGLLVLRGFSGGKFEVRLADAVIAVLPVVVWLLITGKIAKLDISADRIALETREAILEASTRPVEGQVTGLPVVPVEAAEKGASGDLGRLVAEGVQALLFRLGAGGYVGVAIEEYLSALTRSPAFRYVLLEEPDGALFGIVDARKLQALVEQRHVSWDQLADWINADDRDALRILPGFVATDQAIAETTDKQNALARMEKLNTDWLPVISNGGRFLGVVERSRLTASLILDVTAQLKARR